jgi:hypothetical protein
MVQLHRRFTDSQVKELIERSLSKEIERDFCGNELEARSTDREVLFTPSGNFSHHSSNFTIRIVESLLWSAARVALDELRYAPDYGTQ